MKIKLSKSQWEKIGREAGWSREHVATYTDGKRTLKLFGPLVKDPNLKYEAFILDEYGDTEAAVNDSTLSEIYKWAKEHNFTIKN